MFLLGKFKSSMEAANEAIKIRRDWELDFLFGKISVALGDSQKAAEYFSQSLELEPNEESYIELAQLYISQKRFEKAYTLLKEAIRYSEENPTLYEMLGLLAVRLGKVAEASVDFTVCLEADPFDFNALLGLGSIMQAKNEIDEAILKYKYAFTVSPNSSFLWNNAGMCFFEKQKLIAAYTCITKSIYLDPFQWKSYANLGLVCLEL
jgi:tetratricopeptide (TPR) repeat protein